MNKYMFTYWHNGARWFLGIYADSEADAKEKIKAISRAEYDGIINGEIPAEPYAAALHKPKLTLVDE